MSTKTKGTVASSLVIQDVIAEMNRQFELWGDQAGHPNGTGAWDYQLRADTAKRANDEAVRRDSLTWSGILLEEIFEALAEKDVDRLREELVQSAAVICSWVSAIDRNAVDSTSR